MHTCRPSTLGKDVARTPRRGTVLQTPNALATSRLVLCRYQEEFCMSKWKQRHFCMGRQWHEDARMPMTRNIAVLRIIKVEVCAWFTFELAWCKDRQSASPKHQWCWGVADKCHSWHRHIENSTQGNLLWSTPPNSKWNTITLIRQTSGVCRCFWACERYTSCPALPFYVELHASRDMYQLECLSWTHILYVHPQQRDFRFWGRENATYRQRV